jgi:TolB-like protein/DNA-binding winged helix-turn-helix (wHTH) protein
VNFVANAPFRLGQWRIDPALGEISSEGTTVKLEPRAMRLLVCLAEEAGEVVSVNQLLDTVWKDVVVTKYSVYQAVGVLRRVLADDPKDPTYIANVPRRGYRLLAAVSQEAQAQDPAAVATDTPREADLQKQWSSLPEDSPDETRHIALAERGGNQTYGRRMELRYGSIPIALLVLAGCVWWFLRLGDEHPSGTAAASPIRAGTSSATFAPPPHSVAVLPFSNLSGDPRQEYLSDGMTEEVINALSQIDAMKVISRTSSFSFKGQDADIGAIARKLNVEAILEGSVRRSGKEVRITAQLINAANGFYIWSRKYDRDLSDVLALQTEIATSVAHELQARTADRYATADNGVVDATTSRSKTRVTSLLPQRLLARETEHTRTAISGQ